jgi:murein L,D-transpeptidase YafK
MTMRRTFGVIAGAVVFLLAVLVGWDFIAPVRHVPQLAAADGRATSVVVEKRSRLLTLFHDSKAIKSYRVSLGRDPIGAKEREGDSRTPEGNYVIDSKNQRSHFHLALHISYPDAEDRAHAALRDEPPGSDIMIHGLPNGLGWLGRLHLLHDWTDGRIAVTDPEIEQIWALVDTGTPIQIRP